MSDARLKNYIHYDVIRLEREKRELIASVKTLDECRNIVGHSHPASDLALFWVQFERNYLAMTGDGLNPGVPFVARWLLQRSA